jgi:catalase
MLLASAAVLAIAFAGTASGGVRLTGNGLVYAAAPDAIGIGQLPFEAPLYLSQNKGRPPTSYFDNMPPEERSRMQRQYKEWQSLPPEQRDTMRRRMNEWNRMPPQDRDRYQQHYQQWQQLSPEERRRLEDNLQRWDNLSPQERDSIRRRFKN